MCDVVIVEDEGEFEHNIMAARQLDLMREAGQYAASSRWQKYSCGDRAYYIAKCSSTHIHAGTRVMLRNGRCGVTQRQQYHSDDKVDVMWNDDDGGSVSKYVPITQLSRMTSLTMVTPSRGVCTVVTGPGLLALRG